MQFLQVILLFFTIIFISPIFSQTENNEHNNIKLVIHGGCGYIVKKYVSDKREKAIREKLSEALEIGYNILMEGGSSIDAVENVIKILENSPLFNAGKGSVFTYDGTNEMDASIMDGNTLNCGAVASLKTVKNPISCARAVMEKSSHVFLSGSGAESFAKEQGLEIVDPAYFFDKRRWKKFQDKKKMEPFRKPKKQNQDKGKHLPPHINGKYGTVGAVALDKQGNLAAGTSTGGMSNKKYGRIGDSPIIGAGTYANNETCAISSTGHGEYFIRGVFAFDIAAKMKYNGLSLEKAAEEVIMGKLNAMGGTGGVIGVDNKGNHTFIFNTEGMYRGYISSDGQPHIQIFK